MDFKAKRRDMDFHGMKRKQLQSLCKKHGIPANLRNKEMADKLSFILKGKENHWSCQSGSDKYGTNKDMLDVEINELNSSNDNVQQTVTQASPNAMVMNDVDFLKVASEEFGSHLVEGEVDKLDDNNDIHNHGHDCGTEKGELDAEKQDDTNSPHGSNKSIDIDQMVSSDTFELMLPMSQETSAVADQRIALISLPNPLKLQ